MSKNIEGKSDKISLEEDYQQSMDDYYTSLFGPEDQPCILSYEENKRRTQLLLNKLKEWEKKLNDAIE